MLMTLPWTVSASANIIWFRRQKGNLLTGIIIFSIFTSCNVVEESGQKDFWQSNYSIIYIKKECKNSGNIV